MANDPTKRLSANELEKHSLISMARKLEKTKEEVVKQEDKVRK